MCHLHQKNFIHCFTVLFLTSLVLDTVFQLGIVNATSKLELESDIYMVKPNCAVTFQAHKEHRVVLPRSIFSSDFVD